jgi:ketosteroid isomerase-like protein
MSQGNVEIIERGYRLFAANDIDGIAPLLDVDFELRPALARVSEGAVYRGLDGLRQYASDAAQAWARLEQIPERYVDCGDDVIVVTRVEATGRGSGIELSQQVATRWTLRDGKILRGVGYMDLASALEAAGLAE